MGNELTTIVFHQPAHEAGFAGLKGANRAVEKLAGRAHLTN